VAIIQALARRISFGICCWCRATYYHLWFLYSLISIYLSLPVLRLLIQPETDKKIPLVFDRIVVDLPANIDNRKSILELQDQHQRTIGDRLRLLLYLGYLIGEITLSRTRIIHQPQFGQRARRQWCADVDLEVPELICDCQYWLEDQPQYDQIPENLFVSFGLYQ